MLTAQYITSDYYEISPTDSIAIALDQMNELHCKQLAVVQNGVFLGIIEENSLLDEYNIDLPIQNCINSFKAVFLFDTQHIYDALQLIANNDFCIIPILDKNHNYLGSLTKQSILIALKNLLGEEESALIVLELGARDYALSHIARIIEAENTIIYSTAIQKIPDSSKLELTIQLDRSNISAVIASLWRNDYVVKAVFRDNIDQSDLQNRYQLLMNYLDM